jgi:hypothetical protein
MIRLKPKKPIQLKYSFEEKLLFERIQKVRDDFEYNKKQILRKLKER